jgi:hypothetical protein
MSVTPRPPEPAVSVKDFGAMGNASADDTTAFETALGASLAVAVPPGRYLISRSLPLRNRQRLFGWRSEGTYWRPSIEAKSGYNGPLINATSALDYVTIENLTFRGRNASGSKGIYLADADRVQIRHCNFDGFGDQAIHVVAGVAFKAFNIFIDNALLITTGRTDYVGAIQVESQDFELTGIEAGVPTSAIGSGFRAAIMVSGDNGSITNCIAQFSEAGMVIDGDLNKVVGNRADLNYGHGYVIRGGANSIVANHAYRNSRAADNSYDGFLITGDFARANIFSSNIVDTLAADTTRHRYGFNDASTTSTTSEEANQFIGNRIRRPRTARYNFDAANLGGLAEVQGKDWIVNRGKVLASGGIGVGNSAAATTLGSVVRKVEIFDASGASLGFIPVYGSIT